MLSNRTLQLNGSSDSSDYPDGALVKYFADSVTWSFVSGSLPGRTASPPSPEKASEKLRRRRERNLDEVLDEALKDTFPASDPVSINPDPARRSSQ
jgi:hypothetical protein